MTEKLDEIAATTALVIERDKLQRRVRDLERAILLIISQVHAEHHEGGSIEDCTRAVCTIATRYVVQLPALTYSAVVRRWLIENVEPASLEDVCDGTGLLAADAERALESMAAKRLVKKARDGIRWIAVETEG